MNKQFEMLLRVVVITCPSRGQDADHLILPYIKLFHKIKTGLKLVCLSHFLHGF